MSGVVVTGASGQLAQQLKALGVERREWRFFSRGEWNVVSYDEGMRVVGALRPSVVVNCAAYTAVDRAEQEPDAAYRTNAMGPQMLRRVSDALGVRILHISTDYVAGDGRAAPLREVDTVAPRGVYALSKRAGEEALLDSPRAIVLRTGWLYSTYGKNFFLTMARRALEGVDSSVVNDQVGCPTWAGLLARVIVEIAEREEWRAGLYHCSNAGVASWYDFACAIYRALGGNGCVAPIPSAEYPQQAPRPAFSVLDCRKIGLIYGVKIPHWQDSLMACAEEFRRGGTTIKM